MTFASAVLVTGIDSPVTIDSSTDERPSITAAVDRDLLSRPHPQTIANKDGVERDFGLGTVGLNPARGFWCEIEERADRAGGALPGAQLQHLAEQHQHGNCRRRLEINADCPFVAAKSRGKSCGASVATTL